MADAGAPVIHVNVSLLILIAAIFLGGFLRFEVFARLGSEPRMATLIASLAGSTWLLLSLVVIFYAGPSHFVGAKIRVLDIIGYSAALFVLLTLAGKFVARSPWLLAAASAAVCSSLCLLFVCIERYMRAGK
ncbi:MAG: hypothetical protein LAO22_17890 [Acidobacteriia bacterium]|nr:hypothetical protein [Terriglobia bacterium]